MSSEDYHEPLEGLTSYTRIIDQAIVSLMVRHCFSHGSRMDSA
ncbi:hypothetical protein [Candidatus Coxiella mudrowiae]|nr:hypothetical protein [Candidatus Coxiella mudrowiae]